MIAVTAVKNGPATPELSHGSSPWAVAGTMPANGSGLQLSTICNIAMAWILTLPAAMMLLAFLCVLFLNLF